MCARRLGPSWVTLGHVEMREMRRGRHGHTRPPAVHSRTEGCSLGYIELQPRAHRATAWTTDWINMLKVAPPGGA